MKAMSYAGEQNVLILSRCTLKHLGVRTTATSKQPSKGGGGKGIKKL